MDPGQPQAAVRFGVGQRTGRAATTGRTAGRPSNPPMDVRPEPTPPAALLHAKADYDLSGRRAALLGGSLGCGPAWNMLLDLFISSAEGRRLSVSAVCIGSRSSHATASRYLTLLLEAGLVARTADVRDGRRTHVTLTDRGRTCMLSLLLHRSNAA